MRQFYFLLLLAFMSLTTNAQNTFVPDDNFEQALINLGYDSGPLDDFVPTSNINSVSILNVDDKGISDLTGIEDFVALTELRCYTNSMTNIDVSANTQLIYLDCSANSLTSLDVSSNTQLQFLNCGINAITTLNLNQNSLLSNFYATNNQLTALSIRNGAGNIITNFNTINNPNLACIQVDNANYSTNNWTDIDAQSSFSEDCHYGETYVPDDNFEQALIDLGYDSGPLDDYVPTANIDTIDTLSVFNKSISDLTGIEDFEALTTLFCGINLLTNIDVSNNAQLTTLNCSFNNDLISLDVSSNTALTSLSCDLTGLNSLDVSTNIALTVLRCDSNNLISLDISTNTALTTLSCNSNSLNSLNLANNPSLEILNCNNNDLIGLNLKNGNNTIITNFDTTGNSNLTCIQVEDEAYSTTNWTDIDAQTSFSEDCHYGETYVPDDNFEQALIDLGYDTGALDDYVPTANINTVTDLDVNSKSISDLTGIEDFVALTDLSCAINLLSSLDVSYNTALTMLVCSFNSLSSLDVNSNTALEFLACHSNSLNNLDVSNNNALTTLSCSTNNLSGIAVSNNTVLASLICNDNSISSLDLSSNTALRSLTCYNNDLTNIDLSNNIVFENLNCSNNDLTSLKIINGNNTNISIFNALNNPNLTCIEVDDAAYSANNWTNIDAQTSFSEDCHYGETYVPDDNFEQALIDLGYDTGSLDDYVPTANINMVTDLNVDSNSISDLTGIEDFVALTDLSCAINLLTSLDVSNNNALTMLTCSLNSLSSLDVSSNTALTFLSCHVNNLSSLDVSANTALTSLSCTDNNLTSLDISNNTALISLFCHGNSINSLDISNNIVLENLFCYDNNLTGLDLTNNTSLDYLDCNNNELSSLNVKNGNNTIITTFYAMGNPNLTCIEVDDAIYSTTNWTVIDAQTSFNEDCHYDDTYVPDDNFEQALIDLGYDSGPLDDYVPTANINTLTSLNVNNESISDLTGIEDFVALTLLECSNNNLISIDISSNTALSRLYCENNSLTSLDVSNNTVLSQLYVSNNSLSTLDVSNNTALFILICFGNNLNTLDVSNNSSLSLLTCYGNNLSTLDLSINTSLNSLNCATNNLISLNVKNGNNTNFNFFRATSNPNLTCIEVDNAAYSAVNWTNVNPTTSFSEDCSTLSLNAINEHPFSVYPNPVSNELIISSKMNGHFSIINVNGQTLKQGVLNTGNNNIDLSQLKSGLYFLNIKNNSGSILKKVIKK